MNINLTYKTLWTGTECSFLISMLEKLYLFRLTSLITLVLLMLKWLGLLLSRSHLLRSWGSISVLDSIEVLTLSQWLKLPPRKLEPWFVLSSFFFLSLPCISINIPCDLAWNIFVITGQVHRTVGPSLTVSLEALAHHPNAASSSLFYMYYFGKYSSELDEVVLLP